MFENINILTIFMTGLVTGGLTCLAVQGGLLTATLAQRESAFAEASVDKQGHTLPILSFLIAKLVAYTLLGGLLGWLGSFFQLSLQTQIMMQFVVVLFMLGTALSLLNIHPIFRYFIIQPPRFLTRMIRRESKSKSIFAPALLGAFTVFIPCGTTQAMMALVVASGDPLAGAAVLFAFVLGTSPVFFTLGFMAMKLGDILKQRFMKAAAFAIILLALFNLDNALVLSGTPYTISNLFYKSLCVISYCPGDVSAQGVPVTTQTIMITQDGYTPNSFAVRAGSEVTIKLVNENGFGCMQAFTIPSLNIQKVVGPNQTSMFTFTAPKEPGTISFMCSMGMYTGNIEVI